MILQTQHLDSDTIAGRTYSILTYDLQSNAYQKKKKIIEKEEDTNKSSVNIYGITTIQKVLISVIFNSGKFNFVVPHLSLFICARAMLGAMLDEQILVNKKI